MLFRSLLENMLPNDTRVWQAWRRIAADVLESRQPPEYFQNALNIDPELSDLREDQQTLLSHLLRDAHIAYLKYYEVTSGMCFLFSWMIRFYSFM